MSLNVVPVCANCGKISEESISCTKCRHICCPECFNDLVNAAVTAKLDMALLPERICLKCNANSYCATANSFDGNEGAGQGRSTASSSAADQERCSLHGKVCKQFCFNCSVAICAACIDLEDQHDLHRVESLAIVYDAKKCQAEAKLMQAAKLNDELLVENTAYRKNLELLEMEEDTVVKEIEAMVHASKSEVSRLTNDRKRALRGRLNTSTVNETILKDLWQKLDHLSINKFLQQGLEIDEKCSKLAVRQNGIALQKTDDISCDLVPPYQFKRMVYPGFSNAANGDVYVASLNTIYGFEWKFSLRKSAMIQLQLCPNDPELLKFQHKLAVIIPHQDYAKRIHRVFDLLNPNDTFDAVESSHLTEQGFVDNKGDLVIMIGVRPLNIIIEKRLLLHHVTMAAKMVNINSDYLIMHFKPKLSELQNNVPLYSWPIKDGEDRDWRLQITLQSGVLAAYIQLYKDTSATASYFIELKHKDPKKTVVMKSASARSFVKPGLFAFWGFEKFVTTDQLNKDDGFHYDGYLRFRFGVRPSPYEYEVPAPSAANA